MTRSPCCFLKLFDLMVALRATEGLPIKQALPQGYNGLVVISVQPLQSQIVSIIVFEYMQGACLSGNPSSMAQ